MAAAIRMTPLLHRLRKNLQSNHSSAPHGGNRGAKIAA
jgi:hypothetical protein